MVILLMGPPASGKGTIGEKLSQILKLPLVSVGSLIRGMSPNHPRYTEAFEAMKSGMLVPFDIPAQLIKERISQEDCRNGYILDGWARSLGNLSHFDPKPDVVLLFNISDETSIKRISGRRMCRETGEILNIYTLPKEEIEKCKGGLVQREDDREEVVKERLKSYRDQTLSAVKYYRDKGLVVDIDAEPNPDIILKSVLDALKARN